MRAYNRPGQTAAAGRWDNVDGPHTWPNLDRIEVEAMSGDPRAAAYMALADIDAEANRGRAVIVGWTRVEARR